MHPAASVIVFTTLSGLGLGLMFWLGLGAMDVHGWVAFTFCAMALGLTVIGLLSSTLHLGNPQRAWRALSQWRSSWLSREGVASIATLAVFALYALLWVCFDMRLALLGWIAAALAVLTVFCTAMIYAQLKTVPRWNSALTPLVFMLFALALPALLVDLPILGFGYLVALLVAQVLHWRQGDLGLAGRGTTSETATGLGHLGKVRLLEPPHSGGNYLMKEMVFQVGRARAEALRTVTIVLAFAVPLIICLLWLLGWFGHWLVGLAALSHVAGTVTSRWLFFAEAEHSVSLYYKR